MTIIAAIIIAYVAATVQGVVGFGSGMVAMALLPFFLDVKFAVAVVAVVSFFVNGSILYQNKQHIDHRKFLPLLLGGVCGIPFGVLFLHSMNTRVVMIVLGVVIIGYVIWALRLQSSALAPWSRLWGFVAGLFGGALGGAFNTSGPPAVMYVTNQQWEPGAVKATLQVFFFANTIVQVTLFALAGILTREVLMLDAYMIAPVLVGVWSGEKLSSRIDRDRFRKMVLWCLLGLGVVFIARSF